LNILFNLLISQLFPLPLLCFAFVFAIAFFKKQKQKQKAKMWANKEWTDDKSKLPVLVFDSSVFQNRKSKLEAKKSAKTVQDVNIRNLAEAERSISVLANFGFPVVFVVDKKTHNLNDDAVEDVKLKCRTWNKIAMIVPYSTVPDRKLLTPFAMRQVIMTTLEKKEEDIIFLSRRNLLLYSSFAKSDVCRKSIVNILSPMSGFVFSSILWGISRWRKLNNENRQLIGSIYRQLSSNLISKLNETKETNETNEFIPPCRTYISLSNSDKVTKKIAQTYIWLNNFLDYDKITKKRCDQKHTIVTLATNSSENKFSTQLCPICAISIKNLLSSDKSNRVMKFIDGNISWDMKDDVVKHFWEFECLRFGHKVKYDTNTIKTYFSKNLSKSSNLVCRKCVEDDEKKDAHKKEAAVEELRQKMEQDKVYQEMERKRRERIRAKKQKEEEEAKKKNTKYGDQKNPFEQKNPFGKNRNFEDFLRNEGFKFFDNLYGANQYCKPNGEIKTPSFFSSVVISLEDKKNSIEWLTKYRDDEKVALCLTTVPLVPGQLDKSILAKHYRRFALLVHPDKNHLDKSTEAFKILTSIYESLLQTF
jgi:hypothetical protein